MKKNVIAVCDSDAEYACNFAEYLNSRKKLPFQAEAFTNAGTLCDYAGKNPPEILLIAEADVDSQVEKLGTENMIVLSDEKDKEEGQHKFVYKYQSAESVIQEVMNYYTRNSAPAFYAMSERRMSVIGVYSPVSRCGKTLFALTVGQILGERKSVLYVNMEDYSGFDQLFSGHTGKNLTDFFYELRCKEGKMLHCMQELIRPMGKMDYLPPAESPEDVRDILFSEWLQFFDLIRKNSRYEVLILDIGSCTDQLFRILNLCSHVYMPVQEDLMARCKLAQFQKLVKSWGAIEEERIREIRLPAFQPECTDGNLIESLSWGKWGTCVRKVLEKNGEFKTAGKT